MDKLQEVLTKMKKLKWWHYVIIIFAFLMIIGMVNSDVDTSDETVSSAISSSVASIAATATPIPTVTAVPTVKITIDAVAFDKMVKEKIEAINKDNVIDRVETRVPANSSYGVVELYITSTPAWVSISEIEQKEFIKSMGELTDAIAKSFSPDANTETEIYTSSGILLGKRTMFGNIKLED